MRTGRACGTGCAIPRPALRGHLNAFVDGERVTLRTRLTQGAEIVVLTAMSGG